MKKFDLFMETLDEGKCRVWGNCVFTGEPYEVVVDEEGLRRWFSGDPIQSALPDTDADTREFLISGISPNGWRSRFGE
jgi:hypothetical protein